MSRQRIRSSVLESSTDKCPHCGGTGHVRSVSSVTLHLLRMIEEMLLKGATHNLIVRTRTEVALYALNHKRAHLRDLESRFQITITVNADASVGAAQPFLIEKGELVHSVEAAKAILAQQQSPRRRWCDRAKTSSTRSSRTRSRRARPRARPTTKPRPKARTKAKPKARRPTPAEQTERRRERPAARTPPAPRAWTRRARGAARRRSRRREGGRAAARRRATPAQAGRRDARSDDEGAKRRREAEQAETQADGRPAQPGDAAATPSGAAAGADAAADAATGAAARARRRYAGAEWRAGRGRAGCREQQLASSPKWPTRSQTSADRRHEDSAGAPAHAHAGSRSSRSRARRPPAAAEPVDARPAPVPHAGRAAEAPLDRARARADVLLRRDERRAAGCRAAAPEPGARAGPSPMPRARSRRPPRGGGRKAAPLRLVVQARLVRRIR